MSWLTDSWLLRDYVLPALDILLLAFLIYRTYRILVQTRAVQLIKGALFMGLVYLAAFLLRLATLRWVLNLLVPGLVIGMAIAEITSLDPAAVQPAPMEQEDWGE